MYTTCSVCVIYYLHILEFILTLLCLGSYTISNIYQSLGR